MFEGSPSRSKNLKAVVVLKCMPAAVNQSTTVIEYRPLTYNSKWRPPKQRRIPKQGFLIEHKLRICTVVMALSQKVSKKL